jgi:hypothetical protein
MVAVALRPADEIRAAGSASKSVTARQGHQLTLLPLVAIDFHTRGPLQLEQVTMSQKRRDADAVKASQISKRREHRAKTVAHRTLREYHEKRSADMGEEPEGDWDLEWDVRWWWYDDDDYHDQFDLMGELVNTLERVRPSGGLADALDNALEWRRRHPVSVQKKEIANINGERECSVLNWLGMLKEQITLPAEMLAMNAQECRAENLLRSRWRILRQDYDDMQRRAWLIAVLTYPIWLRPLSEWKGTQPRELIEHLLVQYSPTALLRNWLYNVLFSEREDFFKENSPLPWFVCQAQGVSLTRVARHLQWEISSSDINSILSLNEEDFKVLSNWSRRRFDFREGLLITLKASAAIRKEIPAAESEVLQRILGWLIDSGVLQRRDFGVSTAKWLARNIDDLADIDDVYSILRWSVHLHDEGHRDRLHPSFSWKGRTVRSALNAAREYERLIVALRAGTKVLSWSSHGWDWSSPVAKNGETAWKAVELLTSKVLAEEGAAQGHCVGSYADLCFRGTSAIVQIMFRGERKATIEVDPRTKRLVQVRSKFNSMPAPEVAEIVSQWAKQFGLVWS